MGISKGIITARKLLEECGLEGGTDVYLEDIIAYRGAILMESKMYNADGRITHGKNRSIIRINNDIQYHGRRRFTIAHELGHLEMHRDYPIHSDSTSLDWFDTTLKKLKYGQQELEANEFASELLMPATLFKKEASGKKFTPELLNNLADSFQTSITSVAFKCVELNIHPICLFFINNGIVKYWKKSDTLNYFVTDRRELPPHEYSVASEYIDAQYEPIYTKKELQQEISKSVWFTLSKYDHDDPLYEYCIPTKKYKTILSVVWSD